MYSGNKVGGEDFAQKNNVLADDEAFDTCDVKLGGYRSYRREALLCHAPDLGYDLGREERGGQRLFSLLDDLCRRKWRSRETCYCSHLVLAVFAALLLLMETLC